MAVVSVYSIRQGYAVAGRSRRWKKQVKDLTRWGRDYLQVGNAMEIFRRNNVRFIAVNNGIDSEKPDTLEFAPFINIMSEWYAKDISKKVKTGIKTKGMSGKPIVTEAPYGYHAPP